MMVKKVAEPDEISNSFNDFFVNIGPKLASGIKRTGKDFFDYLLNPTQKRSVRETNSC